MGASHIEVRQKRQRSVSWWLNCTGHKLTRENGDGIHKLARKNIAKMDWDMFIDRVCEARDNPSERGFQFLEGALLGWKRRPAEAMAAMDALFSLAEISDPRPLWWKPLARTAVVAGTLCLEDDGGIPMKAMKVLSASEIASRELFVRAIGDCDNSMDAFCLVILAKTSKWLDEEVVLATIRQCEDELKGPNPTGAIIINLLAHITTERKASSELVKKEIIRVWKLKDIKNEVPGRHMFWPMLLTQEGLEEDVEWMIQGLIKDIPEEAADIMQNMPAQKLAKVKPADLKELLCSDQRPIRLGACKIITLLKSPDAKN